MKKYQRILTLASLLVGPICFASTPAATANWEKHCSSCHGPDGTGKTRMGQRLKIKDLTDPEFQAKFTDAQAAAAIKEGIRDKTGKTTMKPIEGLSEEEITALVAHVRALVKP